jgi:hypothetical protein
MACTCVKKEAGTGRGKVKGYIVTSLCSECEAQRQADAILAAERKKEEDANLLIAQRMYEDAKEKLKAEGKIEEVDGKVKIK